MQADRACMTFFSLGKGPPLRLTCVLNQLMTSVGVGTGFKSRSQGSCSCSCCRRHTRAGFSTSTEGGDGSAAWYALLLAYLGFSVTHTCMSSCPSPALVVMSVNLLAALDKHRHSSLPVTPSLTLNPKP